MYELTERRRKLFLHWLASCFLALIIFILYFNSIHSPFMYDDADLITKNAAIKNFKNLPLLFTKEYYAYFGEKTYRPLCTFSFFADYALHGLNPAGFRATNIAFHIFSTVLAYFVIMSATSNFFLSLSAAALFAAHPVQTEAVNLISFREDLMAMAFLLCSLLACVKSAASRGLKRVFWTVFCFAFMTLGIFSKETALMAPAVIFLYNAAFISDGFRAEFEKRKFLYGGFFALVMFYVFVIKICLPHPSALQENALSGLSTPAVLLTMLKVFAYYLKNLAAPVDLYVDYNVEPSHSFFSPAVLFSAAVSAALLALGIMLWRKNKNVSFGILYYFVTLVPVSNIIPFGSFMNDRYLYMPSLGFCMTVACALAGAHGKNTRKGTAAAFCFLMLFYGFFTVKQNALWRDEMAVWMKVLKKEPLSVNAYFAVGNIYAQRGNDGGALHALNNVLKLNPSYAGAYVNRGGIYFRKGLLDAALSDFTKAIQLDPLRGGAYVNSGVAYFQKGMIDEAADDFTKATQLLPQNDEAYYNRGIVYEMKGLYDKALSDFSRVLSINPEDAEAYNERGLLYVKKGLREKAKDDFIMSSRLGFSPARENLKKYFK